MNWYKSFPIGSRRFRAAKKNSLLSPHLLHKSVWSKMAFMLNSSSGPEVAAELGDYLDKTLRTSAHLNQVKQEIKGGRFVSAVSLIIQESAHLWTSDAAADKGTCCNLMAMLGLRLIKAHYSACKWNATFSFFNNNP